MWNAKRFVEVKMANICSNKSWTCETNLRTQVNHTSLAVQFYISAEIIVHCQLKLHLFTDAQLYLHQEKYSMDKKSRSK